MSLESFTVHSVAGYILVYSLESTDTEVEGLNFVSVSGSTSDFEGPPSPTTPATGVTQRPGKGRDRCVGSSL